MIACGAIAHELVTVLKANQLDNVDIQCLPAEWHNTPEKIAPAVEQKIEVAAQSHERVFVAYGDCGTGGKLDQVLAKHGAERLPGDHCYSFFAGNEVFDAMAELPKVCNYLDMPLQHGSDTVLERMRRQITRTETEELIRVAREKVPGIAIRTTLLVGFPGETEEQFQHTLDLMERVKLDNLNTFRWAGYSPLLVLWYL